jgi:hypothetical protein
MELQRSPPELPLFFNEIGAPPHDHPHVYLNMSEQKDILCPYCSTQFRLNPALQWNDTIPANCWAAV